MEPSEVLIFRDYTGWEEPALSTPFGFWSLRNIAVLGVFGMVAGALYWAIVPDDLDIEEDWMLVCIALSPLGVGVLLGSISTPLGTADSLAIALLVLACRSAASGSDSGDGPSDVGRRSSGKNRKRKKSLVLGFPRHLPPPRGAVSPDDKPLEVRCVDLDELKSICVTIHGGDGTRYANRLVSCYLDDELLDVMRTTPDGSLVLNVRPEREGGRRLLIREHVDEPGAGGENVTGEEKEGAVLLSKPLHFLRSGSAGVGGGAPAVPSGGSG